MKKDLKTTSLDMEVVASREVAATLIEEDIEEIMIIREEETTTTTTAEQNMLSLINLIKEIQNRLLIINLPLLIAVWARNLLNRPINLHLKPLTQLLLRKILRLNISRSYKSNKKNCQKRNSID